MNIIVKRTLQLMAGIIVMLAIDFVLLVILFKCS